MLHHPRGFADSSGFQPVAARLSALASLMKLAAPDGFAPSASRFRAGRSTVKLRGSCVR